LSLLRRDIDRKPHKIKRVLTDAGIRKAFLGGVAEDERKAVKAFTNQPENKSNALKKNPKVRGSNIFNDQYADRRRSLCCPISWVGHSNVPHPVLALLQNKDTGAID
jgi:hypothetical protein